MIIFCRIKLQKKLNIYFKVVFFSDPLVRELEIYKCEPKSWILGGKILIYYFPNQYQLLETGNTVNNRIIK